MPTLHTVYLGNLRTEATHIASQTHIHTDAPKDNHGLGATFSPTDLTTASLLSCMMTIMGITANQMNKPIKSMNGSATKVMGANPRRIARIEIKLNIENLEDYTSDELQKIKEDGLNCPVALSLHPDLKQMIELNF
jgi:uncharacterized OsmC-like protein